MQKRRKFILSLLAIANIIIAIMALQLCWKFHHKWVQDGGLSKIEVKYKDELLYVQFYQWMPFMSVWAILNGVILWRARRD